MSSTSTGSQPNNAQQQSSRRARLFPLPLLSASQQAVGLGLPFSSHMYTDSHSHSHTSARIRAREQTRHTVTAVTNRCIRVLNHMYTPTHIHMQAPARTPALGHSSSVSHSHVQLQQQLSQLQQPQAHSAARAHPSVSSGLHVAASSQSHTLHSNSTQPDMSQQPHADTPAQASRGHARGGSDSHSHCSCSAHTHAASTPSHCAAGLPVAPAPPLPSQAQLRLLSPLWQQCAFFVADVRAASLNSDGGSDRAAWIMDVLASNTLAPDLRLGSGSDIKPASARLQTQPSQRSSAAADSYLSRIGDTASDAAITAHALPPPDLLPHVSPYSSARTSVVPLRAERASLPSSVHRVELNTVLPPEVAAAYEHFNAALLRPPPERLALDEATPLPPPRPGGARAEYVALISRMWQLGMLDWTNMPLAINGLFAVAKDNKSDRVVVDARYANRYFVDAPHVSLPNASHIVRLQIANAQRQPLQAAKSDLSDFYHHLGLPTWMQPYFALPALTPEELQSIGRLPLDKPYPMCTTLPMGFSHAVFLAQICHEYVLYSSGAVERGDCILYMDDPNLTPANTRHGVVIDDFFLFALDRERATRVFEHVLAAYRAAGFIVKDSKLVWPTDRAVTIIGMEVGGPHCWVRLPPDSTLNLLEDTLTLLRRGHCTGPGLSHLIGRWVWAMLVRRPALALLQRSYAFIEQAGRRRFRLWPSVQRELWMLIGIAPLLHAHLGAAVHPVALASDATPSAAGVVAAPLTAELQRHLWAICSSRAHATLQTLVASDSALAAMTDSELDVLEPDEERSANDPQLLAQQLLSAARTAYSACYSAVRDGEWRYLFTASWHEAEHINVLELRAALLALHWLLSYPSSHGRRVFLLVDNTVALFGLWKGRSSSFHTLTVLRKVAALLLVSGVSLLPGWVPSSVNPADEASRRVVEGEPPRPL